MLEDLGQAMTPLDTVAKLDDFIVGQVCIVHFVFHVGWWLA